tara:strand:+ start:3841 stop:4785 length:945 start_codon:yes stop_codon:yes gene_type:complete
MNLSKNYLTLLIIVIVSIILIGSSLYIVNEREQAVVFQFGAPVKVSTEAGLHFKTPFIQTVKIFDRRILEWDGMPAEIPLEGKRISIDTFARWKINDPQKFFERVSNIEGAKSRIGNIVEGVVRDEISVSLLKEVVADVQSLRYDNNSYEQQVLFCENFQDVESCPESCIWVQKDDNKNKESICKAGMGRSMIIDQIKKAVQSKLENIDIGVQFVDFQIKRINYTRNVRQKVFQDISAERNKKATEYRTDGARLAREIIASAEAKVKKIYGESFSQDPDFYEFWRGLQVLEQSIDNSTKLIISDDSELFKLFKK